MAAHENLAGGLIGAGGALFAGWLAWSAVREQIEVDKASLRHARIERAEVERESALNRLESIRRVIAFHEPYECAFADPKALLESIAALLDLEADGNLARNYYDELPPHYERLSGPVERFRRIVARYNAEIENASVAAAFESRHRADVATASAARAFLDGMKSFRASLPAAEDRVRKAEDALTLVRGGSASA